MYRKLLGLALAAAPTAAHASWRAATSTHFVVYTEGNAASAKDAVQRLEKFDRVIRFMTRSNLPSSPVKIRVWLMRDAKAVQAAMSFGGSAGIAGFYETNIRGPYAVMTRIVDANSHRTVADLSTIMACRHSRCFCMK